MHARQFEIVKQIKDNWRTTIAAELQPNWLDYLFGIRPTYVQE